MTVESESAKDAGVHGGDKQRLGLGGVGLLKLALDEDIQQIPLAQIHPRTRVRATAQLEFDLLVKFEPAPRTTEKALTSDGTFKDDDLLISPRTRGSACDQADSCAMGSARAVFCFGRLR